MKNNPDLVEVLSLYESSWEKGKEYFLNPKTCNQIIHFSSIVESTTEKYLKFKQDVENQDAEIFITIPCLLILKSLEDEDKGICKSFYPEMFDPKTPQGVLY